MKKIVEIAHEYLKEVLNSDSISIDFTCGQGNDTLFLAQHSSHVYAYDIQIDAINQTRALLVEYEIENVTLFHKSHEFVEEDVASFDCGIFNLGYLPHGDKNITTNGEIVIRTLEKVLQLLNKGGRLVVVLYPGFKAGEEESKMVEHYCEALPSKFYDVASFAMLNRINCPYILVIDKH